MSTTLFQAWNHRWLGTVSIGWTDASGAHTASISTGLLGHLDLTAINLDTDAGGTTSLDVTTLAVALQAAMDAQTAQTVTVTFDASTLRYTITVGGGTFSTLVWSGSAGTMMRRLLGISASAAPSAGSLVSDITPRFIWQAAINGRAAYQQPAMSEDQIKSRRAGGGQVYGIGPTRPIREARWEHRFEANDHLHRRFAASADDWTAESFLEHAALYAMPCVVADDVESMVFYMPRGWGRDAFARSRPDSDLHQTVRVHAESIVGYL